MRRRERCAAVDRRSFVHRDGFRLGISFAAGFVVVFESRVRLSNASLDFDLFVIQKLGTRDALYERSKSGSKPQAEGN